MPSCCTSLLHAADTHTAGGGLCREDTVEFVTRQAPDSVRWLQDCGVEFTRNKGELHLRLAAPLLVVCALTQPFFATCIIMKTSMRGAGATPIVMRWSFTSMLFYRVFVLWMLPHFMQVTLTTVWIVFGMDLLTQAAVFTRLHFKGKWLDAHV